MFESLVDVWTAPSDAVGNDWVGDHAGVTLTNNGTVTTVSGPGGALSNAYSGSTGTGLRNLDFSSEIGTPNNGSPHDGTNGGFSVVMVCKGAASGTFGHVPFGVESSGDQRVYVGTRAGTVSYDRRLLCMIRGTTPPGDYFYTDSGGNFPNDARFDESFAGDGYFRCSTQDTWNATPSEGDASDDHGIGAGGWEVDEFSFGSPANYVILVLTFIEVGGHQYVKLKEYTSGSLTSNSRPYWTSTTNAGTGIDATYTYYGSRNTGAADDLVPIGLFLGATQTGGAAADFSFAQVLVMNSEPTASEIAYLYNSGSYRSSSDIISQIGPALTPLQPGEHPCVIYSHGPGDSNTRRFNPTLNSVSDYTDQYTNFTTYYDIGENGYTHVTLSTPTGNPAYDPSGNQPPMSWTSLGREDSYDNGNNHYWRRTGLAREVMEFDAITRTMLYARFGQNTTGATEGFVPDPFLTIMPAGFGGLEYWFDPNDSVTTNVLDSFIGPFEALCGAFDYGADGGGDNNASHGVNGQTLSQADLTVDWNDVWNPQGRWMFLEAFSRSGSSFNTDHDQDPQIGLTTYIASSSRRAFEEAVEIRADWDPKHIWIERTWAIKNIGQIDYLTKGGATGGTFTLSVNGNTTSSLSWSATPTQVRQAVVAADPTVDGVDEESGVSVYTITDGWGFSWDGTGDSNAVAFAIDTDSTTGGTGLSIEAYQPAQTAQTSGDDNGLTTHRANKLREWDARGFVLGAYAGGAAETIKLLNWLELHHDLPAVRKKCGAFVWDDGSDFKIALRLHHPGGWSGAPSFTAGTFTGGSPTGTIYVDGSALSTGSIDDEDVGITADSSVADGRSSYWHIISIDSAVGWTNEKIQVTAPSGTWTEATDGDCRAIELMECAWLSNGGDVQTSLPSASGEPRGYVELDGTNRKTGYVHNIGNPTIGASFQVDCALKNEGGTELDIVSHDIGGRAENISRWSVSDQSSLTVAAYSASVGSRDIHASITPDGRAVNETYCIITDDPTCPVHRFYIRSNYPGYFRLWSSEEWSSANEVEDNDSIDVGDMIVGIGKDCWLYGWNEGDNDIDAASMSATTLPSTATMKVYGLVSGAWSDLGVDDIDELDDLEPYDSFAIRLTFTPTSGGAYSEDVVFNHGKNHSDGAGGVSTGGFTITFTGDATDLSEGASGGGAGEMSKSRSRGRGTRGR